MPSSSQEPRAHVRSFEMMVESPRTDEDPWGHRVDFDLDLAPGERVIQVEDADHPQQIGWHIVKVWIASGEKAVGNG